ncbi:MAG TPA: DUF4270 domain-containing protein [Aquaticitalea sp.]|nr:DUF4270 domain-containing protein [Aquaticitalea sp.]HNU59562.1 DUF4270 domain-containing protein [Aquaticitalea sp.]
MINHNRFLKYISALALLTFTFIACDKDYATVGTDIIGDNNFDNDHKIYELKAYTNRLAPVQTNGLPINYLGVYKDPTYGLTTANFVSQMGSNNLGVEFGENVKMDSVVLTIPYFSTAIERNSDGVTTYELDSVYGSAPIVLTIYENTYFLRDFDPNGDFSTPLAYYSNASTTEGPMDTSFFEGSVIYTNSSFVPRNEEIQLWDTDGEITSRLAPSFRVHLDTTYWRNKIMDKEGEPELSNLNNFQNYFRGLYFKATPIDNNGTMTLLDFGASGANITIYYTRDSAIEDADPINATFVMPFTGNKINFFENQYSLTIPDGNPSTGDEKLYLKGGEGATAVLDLFNGSGAEDGFSPEFLAFKNEFVETDADGKFVKSKRLINEANLVFYVDQDAVAGSEPERIYIYDLKNKTPLVDYYNDLTNTSYPEISKSSHLGILEREGNTASGAGIRYKLKITEHIKNLLLKDSANVGLGVSVSGNVNLENDNLQYKVLAPDENLVKTLPVSSILSPHGTILYGNNTSDETKKLYLEIYYTEPNN